MESNESAFDSFKSKKILISSSKSSSAPSEPTTLPHHDKNPWDSKTPEKPINPPRRTRNRGAALSLKEVREAAQKLRKAEPGPPTRTDPLLTSAKEQIPLWPESSPSKLKKSDSSPKLPEKYEMLDKFFSSLDSSIRLLRIKGSATTFANISPKIECLTDRRFTYSHLAQLKFIFPEAIEVKKILIRDERTNCMKPVLHLALNANAIENNGKTKSESGNVQLRKVFRARLCDFFKAHPEGDEIPEEVLPEPFNQSKKCIETKTLGSSFVSQTPTAAPSERPMSIACHLSQSFKRHFSQQVPDHNGGNTIEGEIASSGHTAPLPVLEACFAQQNSKNRTCVSADASPVKFSSKPVSNVECSSNKASLAKLPISPPPATPVKNVDSYKSLDPSSNGATATMGTPAPPACTPAKLMSATPGLRETKRCYMSPNDDDSTQSPNKLVRRPSRSRSLKFDTPVKGASIANDVEERECSSVDNDVLDILPETLIQSIREKERKALLEQDPAISQAKWRQQMIAGLPKLFDMIYFLFQSIRRSVITKEELMHKIVSSHLDIVDRREVEEKLRLLQELVPEWIYEKLALSEDLLVCVNKISCPELIRTRLAEASNGLIINTWQKGS